ncbi:MAG: hypothetical protein ACR2LX_12890 [Jatrophihabitans sp.]
MFSTEAGRLRGADGSRRSAKGVTGTVVLVALLVSAACSSSTGSAAKSDIPKASKADTSTSTRTTAAAPTVQPNTLDVVGLDYKYKITGSPKPGLVTITFDNRADDAHEMSLALLKPGKTLAEAKKALAGPNAEKAAGALLQNPNSEITSPAITGASHRVTVTAKLAAGHYIVTCFLPGPHGMPHAAMGMIAEFTVAGAPATAPAPKTDGTVELKDAGISLPSTFGKGGTFAVTNTGTKAHDFAVAKLGSLTVPGLFRCVGASFGKGTPIDKCSGTIVGGITTLQTGESGYLTITLGKGKYGYLSTEGNGADLKAGLMGTFAVA